MFAKLGDIEFELINFFNSLGESNSYNYAEHSRINQKPVLQFLGENLQEQSIKLNLHSSFCIPEEQIAKFKDAAKNGQPLKYVKGNGEYIGAFVITGIDNTTEMADADGNIVLATLDLKLREYTGKMPPDKKESQGMKQK